MEPLSIQVKEDIQVRTAEITTTHIDGREQGIRYADSDGHAASADLNPDGRAIVGVQGVIPSGCGFELPTAQVFVEHRRGLGLHFGEPWKVKPDNCGIDCIADNLDDTDDPLRMQITNAIPDHSYWEKQNKSIDREFHEMPVDDRVSHLWQAAEKKINKKRYPARKDTMLLLSAWLSLAHATTEVVEQFRALHSKEARLGGFLAVWVVGPNTAHTFRLDTD
jgi:hypothetical protein